MKIPAEDIESFFVGTGEREAQLRQLDTLVREAAPELPRELAQRVGGGAMIGYGKYRYVYASGREGDWWTVMLANQKQYISLYICAVLRDGTYVPERYEQKLGKVSVGKSCIRIKNVADIDLDELKKALREAVMWYKQQPQPL